MDDRSACDDMESGVASASCIIDADVVHTFGSCDVAVCDDVCDVAIYRFNSI